MDLDDLRLFVTAAEMNSFTKAAVALGIAQPSVSRVIKELEDEWRGKLFYRTGRGVALSELGEAAVARARGLLREAEQVSEDMRAFSQLPTGVVTLALPPSLVCPVVPTLVNQVRSIFPGIRLRVYEGLSDQIERWVANGDVDIGIWSKYRRTRPSTDTVLLESELVLARAANAPYLPPEIPFSELERLPLVLPTSRNGLRAIVEETAAKMRISLNVVVDADSISAQKEIALRCGCYMIKAPQTVSDEKASGVFSVSVIREPTIFRRLILVTGRQRPLSRAAREVADRVTATVKALAR